MIFRMCSRCIWGFPDPYFLYFVLYDNRFKFLRAFQYFLWFQILFIFFVFTCSVSFIFLSCPKFPIWWHFNVLSYSYFFMLLCFVTFLILFTFFRFHILNILSIFFMFFMFSSFSIFFQVFLNKFNIFASSILPSFLCTQVRVCLGMEGFHLINKYPKSLGPTASSWLKVKFRHCHCNRMPNDGAIETNSNLSDRNKRNKQLQVYFTKYEEIHCITRPFLDVTQVLIRQNPFNVVDCSLVTGQYCPNGNRFKQLQEKSVERERLS